MGLREEIQKRVDRKYSEIMDLETRIKEFRIYIQALEDTLKMLPRENVSAIGDPSLELRTGSRVAKAREYLLVTGAPQHVMKILEAIGEKATKETRAALSGSLSAYVRKNEIFTRPGPNVFGLIEFATSGSSKGPPPGFGQDDLGEEEDEPANALRS